MRTSAALPWQPVVQVQLHSAGDASPPAALLLHYTYVADSTPLRAIQAVSNGIQMLAFCGP